MSNGENITLSATLSYNGAPFCGFARQPGQLTIQGELEDALAVLFHRPVETTCAGRTDAGVHARAQVISFDVSPQEYAGRACANLVRSLNALTHDAISVRWIERRASGFSARFDALMREYRYHICVQTPPPVFMRDFSWHLPKPLDVEAMRKAAQCLIGEHDFKSFCLAASAKGKPTARNIHEISFDTDEFFGEEVLVITVKGNAFLHSMVRTLVGTLVLIGSHQRESEWMAAVLAACDRKAAGQTAPACGLVLWDVVYR